MVGLLFGAAIARLSGQSLPPGAEPRLWFFSRMLMRGSGTVPFVIGAISLIAETGGGLYWIVAGIVFAIAGAVANAWVLLVEILR